MIKARTEDDKFSEKKYERAGLFDEDNGKLDDTWWVKGHKDKKIFHRQQWNEGGKSVNIMESIWASFYVHTSSGIPQ